MSERRLGVQVGVTFPQSEIGADSAVIRDYAQAAEDLGYEHLLAYDHVLGADPSNREGWRGYTHKTMFHEPLTLFSYLAAITKCLELVSGVIVLPQRQSALVARQAAEVDVLSPTVPVAACGFIGRVPLLSEARALLRTIFGTYR